jgi:hypothetical protein
MNADDFVTYGLGTLFFALALGVLAWIVYMIWEEFF